MGFMLARLQVKYGHVAEVIEIMEHIKAGVERQGWTLVGGYQTTIGRFHEIWDLWDLNGDASAIGRALTEARQDPEFAQWAAKLPQFVEEEETRYMEKLPYSP
jgi:quinol monooxygenase YgiN